MRAYAYHITMQNWGKSKVLKPRKTGYNRACDEPQVSRTCVCPTIEGCLIALGACLPFVYAGLGYIWSAKTEEYSKRKIYAYVYRTENPVGLNKPYEVDDAQITGERWLIKPAKFILIGKILLDNRGILKHVQRLNPGNRAEIIKQKNVLNKLKKAKLSYMDWINV